MEREREREKERKLAKLLIFKEGKKKDDVSHER